MNTVNVYAAVHTKEQLESALNSDVSSIFHLEPNIKTLSETVKAVHKKGKRLFIHMDLAEGIGKDKYGVEYVKELSVDGIISTRASIIRYAKENELFTVQRFFIVDSQAVATTVESVKNSKPDMIEVMPGIAVKAIERLRTQVMVPIIAGGLIETEEEISEAIKSGAVAVSTGKAELWNIVK